MEQQTTKKRTMYPAELKVEAVQTFLAGDMTRSEIVEHFGIASESTFKKWLIEYRREGIGSLQPKRRGRPPKQHVPQFKEPPEALLVRAEVKRLTRKLGA